VRTEIYILLIGSDAPRDRPVFECACLPPDVSERRHSGMPASGDMLAKDPINQGERGRAEDLDESHDSNTRTRRHRRTSALAVLKMISDALCECHCFVLARPGEEGDAEEGIAL
jgi:hypothetical protein